MFNKVPCGTVVFWTYIHYIEVDTNPNSYILSKSPVEKKGSIQCRAVCGSSLTVLPFLSVYLPSLHLASVLLSLLVRTPLTLLSVSSSLNSSTFTPPPHRRASPTLQACLANLHHLTWQRGYSCGNGTRAPRTRWCSPRTCRLRRCWQCRGTGGSQVPSPFPQLAPGSSLLYTMKQGSIF